MLLVTEINDLFKDRLKLRREELVGLVHDDGAAFAKIRNLFRGQVKNTAGGGNNNVHRVVETHDIIFERRSPRSNHALNPHMLSNLLDNSRCLQGKLSRGDEDKNLNIGLRSIRLLQAGDNVRSRLPRPVLGSGQDIPILKNDGNGLFLNGGRLFKSLLEYTHEELSLEEEIFKVSSLGLRDVLGLVTFIFLGGSETIFVGSRAGDRFFVC